MGALTVPESSWAERALYYTRHVAERIGPRGAATPEEKRAADYTRMQMQKLGVRDVRLESFDTPTGGWTALAMALSIAVWGAVLCWVAFYATQTRIVGGVIGALLCALALWIIYREFTLRDHFIRRILSRGRSQNAIGQIPPAESLAQRAVLVCHLDTNPVSRLWQSPRRARLFRWVLRLSVLSLFVGLIMFLLGGLDVWEWAFVLAGVCGLLQSAGIVLSIQADRGNFSPGANNNASGVGTVLALVERLQSAPLQNTEVWAVYCGGRTAGGSGLRALLQRHAEELRDAWFIGFEGVGVGRRLIYINREGRLRQSIQPAVNDLVERAARARPDLAVEPHATERNSAVSPAFWRGFKSICLSVYDDQNEIPLANSRGDVAPRIQLEALNKAQDFGWELLQQIDRAAEARGN